MWKQFFLKEVYSNLLDQPPWLVYGDYVPATQDVDPMLDWYLTSVVDRGKALG